MSISTISSAATSAASTSQTKHKGPLDTVASLLDMSKSDLVKELKSGKSMDDVAKTAGVSHDDLVKALKKDMPEELASSDRADEIAEAMSTRKGMPTRGPGGPGGHMGPPPPEKDDDDSDPDSTGVLGTSLSSSQTSTLKQLSELLGTDSDSLLDSLKSGASLSDLVSKKGVSSSALAGVVQDGLLIDTKA